MLVMSVKNTSETLCHEAERKDHIRLIKDFKNLMSVPDALEQILEQRLHFTRRATSSSLFLPVHLCPY